MSRNTRSRTNTNTRPIMPAKKTLIDFQSRFDLHKLFIHGLQIYWIGLVYWLEVGVFNWAFHACDWPGPELVSDFTFTAFADVMTNCVSLRIQIHLPLTQPAFCSLPTPKS